MGLNIKNLETEHLVHTTEAVGQRLNRLQQGRTAGLAERVMDTGRDCASALKELFRSVESGDELEAANRAGAIAETPIRRISATNFLETAIMINGSRDPIASRRLDELLRKAESSIEPVSEA